MAFPWDGDVYDLSVAGSSKYGSKVRTALDKSGNVFLDYNPGRYNGVIVLRPVAGGFANFRTLPTPGDFNGRFYFAELSDADSDGTYEIISSSNDCTPSCAEGTTTSTVWRWNGHDYVTG